MPPAFSAKKIHGRPAHELARKNKPVELKPVDVEVFDFRLLEMEGSRARFAIECGPGTYVRSLAFDMGAQIGCGAHVSEITRTAVGEFTLDQAISLGDLDQAVQVGKAADWILPLGRHCFAICRACACCLWLSGAFAMDPRFRSRWRKSSSGRAETSAGSHGRA